MRGKIMYPLRGLATIGSPYEGEEILQHNFKRVFYLLADPLLYDWQQTLLFIVLKEERVSDYFFKNHWVGR